MADLSGRQFMADLDVDRWRTGRLLYAEFQTVIIR